MNFEQGAKDTKSEAVDMGKLVQEWRQQREEFKARIDDLVNEYHEKTKATWEMPLDADGVGSRMAQEVREYVANLEADRFKAQLQSGIDVMQKLHTDLNPLKASADSKALEMAFESGSPILETSSWVAGFKELHSVECARVNAIFGRIRDAFQEAGLDLASNTSSSGQTLWETGHTLFEDALNKLVSEANQESPRIRTTEALGLVFLLRETAEHLHYTGTVFSQKLNAAATAGHQVLEAANRLLEPAPDGQTMEAYTNALKELSKEFIQRVQVEVFAGGKSGEDLQRAGQKIGAELAAKIEALRGSR